jgi:hypothetical protein
MGLLLLQMAGHPGRSWPPNGPQRFSFRSDLDARETMMIADVFKCDARKMYNKNWDGCRDLWKEHYRKRMSLRGQPAPPRDPQIIEFERREREREQAYRKRFNRNQQERYERWLKENKPD